MRRVKRRPFAFDRFRALEQVIGAKSWFSDPSAPWQRGAVENANKRICRHMPGDTDLTEVRQHARLLLGPSEACRRFLCAHRSWYSLYFPIYGKTISTIDKKYTAIQTAVKFGMVNF